MKNIKNFESFKKYNVGDIVKIHDNDKHIRVGVVQELDEPFVYKIQLPDGVNYYAYYTNIIGLATEQDMVNYDVEQKAKKYNL